MKNSKCNVLGISMPIYPLQRVFTPKIVGTFYMQGYKVKEKTAIVPPVSKLSGHPEYFYVLFEVVKSTPQTPNVYTMLIAPTFSAMC